MLLACAVSLRLSRYGFSGFDVSPLVDSGWRVFSGQIPGRDFVVTFPASLYLSTAFSFHLFGVTWRAIALGACLLYLVLCLLGMRVASLRRDTDGSSEALLLAAGFVGAQTILLVSINYLWHAAMAESFAIYAVLTSSALLRRSTRPVKESVELTFHLTLAFACLTLSKPNTAFPAILLCIWVLLRGRVSRWIVGTAVAGACLLASAALATARLSLISMLASYAGLTGRLVPKPFANGILFELYARYGVANLLVYTILGFCGAGLFQKVWESRRAGPIQPREMLAIGSVAIAILGMGTNFDFKLTDTPLFLMGLLLYSMPEQGPGRLLRSKGNSRCGVALPARGLLRRDPFSYADRRPVGRRQVRYESRFSRSVLWAVHSVSDRSRDAKRSRPRSRVAW